MIIKELDLKNIRSHKDSSINFTEGINIITGNTGSGKSSLLMAIQYTLFGKIGEGHGEGKLLLRRGENGGSIALKFEEGGSEYLIRRGLKKFKDTVRNDDSQNEIFKDGKLIDLQNRAADLNTYIMNALRIRSADPIKTFEAITYIKQDELKDLIFETGQSKQEHVDQLLQLNKYADTYDSLKDVISKIENELKVSRMEESLTGDENEVIKLESRISHLDSLNSQAWKTLERLQNELKNDEIRAKELESELKFYRDKKNDFIRASTEKSGKLAQIEKLEKRLSDTSKLIESKEKSLVNIDENAEKRLKEAVETSEAKKKDLANKQRLAYETFCRIESEEKSSAQHISQLDNDTKRLVKQNEDLSAKAKGIKDQLQKEAGINEDEITGRITQLNSFLEGLKKEKLSSLKSGVCALCGEKIKNRDHLEKEYDNKIRGYETDIESLLKEKSKRTAGKTRKELEREYDKLLITIKQNSEKIESNNVSIGNSDIKALASNTATSRKEYEAISESARLLDAEIDGLKQELVKIDQIKDVINEIKLLKSKMDDTGAELRRAEEESLQIDELLKKTDFNQAELDKKEQDFNAIEKTIKSLSSDASGIKGEIATRKSELDDNAAKLDELKIKIKKKDELRRIIEKKERFLTLIENLRRDIRDIREYVRNKFIKDFKTLFQTRFLEIRNESEYTIDIDNNYNVKVVAENEQLDAKTLSGGEKTSVALAYRMALSSIASLLGGLSKNESLLMDEPTSGLDREDINALSTCITKIKDLSQIVIVTHEDTMKNIADNLISVAKVSGESVVSSSK